MRLIKLLLVPLAVLAGASLVPSSAHAAKVGICAEKQSVIRCPPVYDFGDCIVVDEQLYCRTMMLYYWHL